MWVCTYSLSPPGGGGGGGGGDGLIRIVLFELSDKPASMDLQARSQTFLLGWSIG